jgi:hypothetical protein
VKNLERPHLVGDPRAELVGPAALRLLSERAEHARVGSAPAIPPLLIDVIPLEAPRFKRTVDLGGNEVSAQRSVGPAAVDDGLLAALDGTHDVDQQMILDQGLEMG